MSKPRPQRPSPVRYRVTLHRREGEVVTRDVLTWLYAEKAIALALFSHLRDHPDDLVYDVEVEEVGSAHTKPDGSIDIGEGYLFDRWEF